MSTLTRTVRVLSAGALMALAVAAPAGAATVKLSGGSTTLKLDPATAKALKGLGVSVAPIAPAKAGTKGVSFPITGGSIDPATAAGTITHSGGLQLRAGATRVRLTSFTIGVDRTPTISVKAGKARLHAFSLSLAAAKVSRAGLGTNVSGVAVKLSAKGAAALNGAFGVKAFKRGLRVGTATVKATPAQVAFTGGATSLALDPGTAQALTALGIAAAPAAPATANPDGSLAFPITGGKVNAKTLAGAINHSGGLTLTKGSTAVTVTDFTIETAPAPKLTARLGTSRFDLATLDLGAAKVAISGRSVTVGPVTAKLTKGAADALNRAFGTTAFTEGLVVGTATVSATAA
ncbi:MAG: hypothetical protein ACXWZZ_14165 [Solirubrobacteraceae bacterium]